MTNSPGTAANAGRSVPITERRFLAPFILITSLFFLWAFGVNLNDILIPHLKKAFGLTDFQSSFIQVAFFGGYFLAAFPAGRVMEKIGYKNGILAGLFLCAAGAVLFLPASSSRVYGFFLFALFVMACGQSFLEVAANPYVTILGPAASAERRLNFAQSFNAVGAVLSPILGRAFILTGVEYAPAQIAAVSAAQLGAYRAAEASTVKGPYLMIAAIFVVVAVLIHLAHLPDVQETAVGAAGTEKSGAIFLCGCSGWSSELRDSLRAVLGSGNNGESGSAVLVAASGGIHGRAFHRLGADEKDCGAALAVSFCRSISRLCHSGFAGYRSNTGVGGCDHRFLSLHHVPYDLRAEYQESGCAHEARFIAAGYGDCGRRIFSCDHGAHFRCGEYSESVPRAATVLRVYPLFWAVGIQARRHTGPGEDFIGK